MEKRSLKSDVSDIQQHWKDDLKAGFNVSLIALPLCLGIAVASGFPPIAGLFAAIIGGLLISRINGSFVTITGPAAGLIVVNLAAVESLGEGDMAAGYPYALAAIFMAGILVTLLGFLKAGRFGDFFPTAAVHGMLAAIGIIIMVKQLFVATAFQPHGHEFYQIVTEIPEALSNAHPAVFSIALVSMAVLVFHSKIPVAFVRLVPAPLWVIVVAIPMAYLMDFQHEHVFLLFGTEYTTYPNFLVQLPDSITDGIVMPDFGKIATSAFWIAVMSIGLVTALESLLSALAVDALDPQKRKTDLDRDLKGLGVGASASSLIGGLPMISEIVRSSANVASGARSQWSNFFHGLILLLFLVVGAAVINLIPLSALAAMLIFTGFRLASPNEFKHMYHIGKTEIMVFMVTIVVVLTTDLLIGIAVGILTNLLANVLKGTAPLKLFTSQVTAHLSEHQVKLALSGAHVFSNYLGLKGILMQHADKNLILDLKEATLLDHTVIHHLHGFKRDQERKGLTVAFINDSHLEPESTHPLSELKVGNNPESLDLAQG